MAKEGGNLEGLYYHFFPSAQPLHCLGILKSVLKSVVFVAKMDGIKTPPDEVDASTVAYQRPFPSFSGAVQSGREYLKWRYCENV